jgi:hypothetical protein
MSKRAPKATTKVINLAAYKTKHGIEYVAPRNIFGAAIYHYRNPRCRFQVGDIVVDRDWALRGAQCNHVEVTAVEVDDEGCCLSFDERPPIYGAQYFTLVKSAKQRCNSHY